MRLVNKNGTKMYVNDRLNMAAFAKKGKWILFLASDHCWFPNETSLIEFMQWAETSISASNLNHIFFSTDAS